MKERIQRVNHLIQEELGRILYREVEFPEGALVTLTRVEVSPDLNQARAYISTMPTVEAGKVLTILNGSLYVLQQKLNKKLNMRPLPRIVFVEEKATSKAGEIEKLLEEIHKKIQKPSRET